MPRHAICERTRFTCFAKLSLLLILLLLIILLLLKHSSVVKFGTFPPLICIIVDGLHLANDKHSAGTDGFCKQLHSAPEKSVFFLIAVRLPNFRRRAQCGLFRRYERLAFSFAWSTL